MIEAVIEVVAAAGAQRRDLALVVAVGVAELVLRQAGMMEFRLCNVGHENTCDFSLVMAGLVPAIHVLAEKKEDVDARHKAGHDVGKIKGLVMTRPCGEGSLSDGPDGRRWRWR